MMLKWLCSVPLLLLAVTIEVVDGFLMRQRLKAVGGRLGLRVGFAKLKG